MGDLLYLLIFLPSSYPNWYLPHQNYLLMTSLFISYLLFLFVLKYLKGYKCKLIMWQAIFTINIFVHIINKTTQYLEVICL